MADFWPVASQNLIRAYGDTKGDPDGSRGADEFEVSTPDAPVHPLKNFDTSTDRYRSPAEKGDMDG